MHDINHALIIIKEHLDLAVLELNANGQAEITFAEGLAAHITQISPTKMELSFQLPDLDFASEGMMRAMLASNFLGTATGAGRLAIDAAKDEVVYCERWDLIDIDARSVERRLTDFVAFGGFWLTEGSQAILAEAEKYEATRPVVVEVETSEPTSDFSFADYEDLPETVTAPAATTLQPEVMFRL